MSSIIPRFLNRWDCAVFTPVSALDASSISINDFLEKNIEKGNTIHTDGWNGYNQLKSVGYYRKIIKESANVGNDPLSHCHLIISLFKRWLLGTYQGSVKPEHLDYYLDEYTFRFNRRKSRSRGKLVSTANCCYRSCN